MSDITIPEDLLQKLPISLRIEVDENIERKPYSTLELAELQNKLHSQLTSMYPSGRKCKQDGTLKQKGFKRVDDLIGKLTGDSGEQVRRRREIRKAFEKNPTKYQNTLKKVDTGKTTLTTLYYQVNRRENPKTPLLPKGQYNVIYADPPWEYEFGLTGSAADHYPTMKLDDIKELGKKIPAAKDAYLFLWGTLSKPEEAIEVINSWGFKVRSQMVWVKERNGILQNGTGYYVKGVHENLYICKRGNIPVPAEEFRHTSVVKAPRGRHSVKPEIFYGIIETMVPNAKYLELFARPKKKRIGWTYWGNDVK